MVTLLQSLVRPADQVTLAHLEALGVHVVADVSLVGLVPDPSSIPDFDKWDTLSREESHVVDAEPRPKLGNGRPAPGAAKYVDLRQGLLTENDRAFRAVRRVAPRPGEQYVRLGYCHEFFRHLETLTGFWEDTSTTVLSKEPGGRPIVEGDEVAENPTGEETASFYRTSAGSAMPAQYRTQLLNAFLKLVTYDFCCTIMSRQEPRLYIKSSPPSTQNGPSSSPVPDYRHSYFSSGCSFIFRMPLDRESAKRGIIDGPVAAVSPRHTTVFPPIGRERESVIDLSREIIAALITAQHRAREGREEVRIGQDSWWTTRRRWGGGPGGPIGKEAEVLEARDVGAVLIGDKDERPNTRATVVEGDGSPPTRDGASSLHTTSPLSMGTRNRFLRPSSSSRSAAGGSPGGGGGDRNQRQGHDEQGQGLTPPSKRPRKGLAIYDTYRMVRPPSRQWDPKTRYSAIGRQRGVDYDDIFVISSLFHHMSILRVRVPDRLMSVLDGGPDEGRGELEVYRTRWYDFFVAQDRIDAMRAVWVVVAYSMREINNDEDGDNEGGGKEEESKKMDIDEEGLRG